MEYIHIGVFPFFLGVCDDIKVLEEEVLRLTGKQETYDDGAPARCVRLIDKEKGGLRILVFISPKSAQQNGLIVHESVHVKQYVMEEIGEKEIGIETEAYFVQAVFLGIKRALKKLKKTRNCQGKLDS